MAINESVQYNDGLLPDIILLIQCYYHQSGNPFKCHEEVLYLQPFFDPPQSGAVPYVQLGYAAFFTFQCPN